MHYNSFLCLQRLDTYLAPHTYCNPQFLDVFFPHDKFCFIVGAQVCRLSNAHKDILYLPLCPLSFILFNGSALGFFFFLWPFPSLTVFLQEFWLKVKHPKSTTGCQKSRGPFAPRLSPHMYRPGSICVEKRTPLSTLTAL